MHINKCSKCGKDFETKNPKRIVCPNCLYLDRAAAPSVIPIQRPGAPPPPQGRPGGHQGHGGGGYGPPRPGGYGPPGGGYGGPGGGRGGPGGGRGGPGGYNRGGPGGGRGGPGGPGGFNRGGPGGGFNRGGPPRRGPHQQQRPPARKLLVPKEVLAQIEMKYKPLLPLPNPDAHVKIAEELNLDPKKVFFGINLIRQKMKLPKLEFPKRPLAVTEEQLMAVKMLYEPFLPLPPIGIHKILAKQLKMDEWRVHVAIGLIRKQMQMPRWNEERQDLPDKMKEELLALQQAAAKDGGAASEEEKPAAATSKAKKESKKASSAEE